MQSRLAALCAAVSSLSLLSPILAQTKPKNPVPLENRAEAQKIVQQLLREGRIIDPKTVKRGMRGVARSVFQGTKIEEFNVEVLGNLSKANGGGDIILIRVLDGPVVKRQSGIIAGMSGSPVYINGKMLGAIALGWGFPKEPIGGVTPVTQMIEFALPDVVKPSVKAGLSVSKNPQTNPQKPVQVLAGAGSIYKPNAPLTLGGKRIAQMEISRDPKRVALRGPLDGATMTMKPATTLLQIGGFAASSLDRWKHVFEPYGVEPVMGIPSKKSGVKANLEPGAAIGVQLVSGDMDQTAVGTVTFRWGNRVLAFGHPMFGSGTASLPMTTSFIHEIFPSYQRSFKLASPIDTVGALQQDTQFAIGGTVGAKADTIPMTISIREPARQIAKTYRVRVMKDPNLTPQLIAGVAQEAIETTLGQTSDKMVRVGLDMKIDGAKPIKRRNLLYSNQTITGAALNDLGQTLSLTQANEFARGSISRVDLSVLVEPKRRTARIKSMTADRNKAKAGETIGVTVEMEPTDRPGQTFSRNFQFKVPDDAPTGAMRIASSIAANYWGLQLRVGGAPPDPNTLPQLIDAWDKVGPLNELIVVASTPQRFLQVEQQRILNAPPTFAKLLQSAPISNIGSFNEVEVRREPTDFMLSGAQFLTIPIESRRHPESDDENAADAAKTTVIANTDNAPTITIENADNGGPNGNAAWGASTWSDMNALFTQSHFLKYLQNAKSQRQAQRDIQRQQGELPTLNPTPTPTPAANAPTATGGNSGPNQTPTPEPTAIPTPTATPDANSLARPAQTWVQTPAEFLTGRFENTQVSSAGRLQIAPASERVVQTAEPFVWAIAGNANGDTFLGLANPARVVKVTRNGQRETVWSSRDIVVSALTTDDKGNVYAGASPSGSVWRIESGPNRVPILNTTQSFVGALEWDEKGRLLVGTGGEKAKLFRLDNPAAANSSGAAPNAAQPLVTLEENQIRAISARGDEIFVGTGSDAVLYRIGANGSATALYQVGDRAAKGNEEIEILGVAAAPDAVYFGASNTGTIYCWKADEGVTALYPSPQQSVFALRRGKNGKLYAATGNKGVVYEIEPGRNANDTRAARLLEPQPTQSLALALAPNDTLLVGTGNTGSAYRVGLNDTQSGTFYSGVLDAKSLVQWGALRTIGRDFTLETRSGNTLNPDETWNDWQQVLAEGEQSRVQSPPARYLQYRATLKSNGKAVWDDNSANLTRVEVVYRAKNSAPQVALAVPRGGEWFSDKAKLSWQAKDPDSDTLRYKLWLSSDDGKTWQSVPLDDADKTTFDLDTSKYQDGTYRARVEASDANRNPDDPQTDSFTSQPFVIDNGAPKIDNAAVVKDGDDFKISAQVSDTMSPIAGAVWRWEPPKVEVKTDAKDAKTASKTDAPSTPASAVATAVTAGGSSATDITLIDTTEKVGAKKDDNWNALAARDGLFDSRSEAVLGVIRSEDLPKTTDDKANPKMPRRIEIRAQDAAGNTHIVTVALP